MKKVYTIVFLGVLFTLSYFAYNKVCSDDRKELKTANANLTSQLSEAQSQLQQFKSNSQANDNKLHDTLCVALPDSKKVIDGVFGRTPPAVATTAPAKVEK